MKRLVLLLGVLSALHCAPGQIGGPATPFDARTTELATVPRDQQSDEVESAFDAATSTDAETDVVIVPDRVVVNDVAEMDVVPLDSSSPRDVVATMDVVMPDVVSLAEAGPGCATPLPAPTADTLTPRPKGTTCSHLGYYEYVPAGYSSRRDWPLLLAFHGDGERGNGSTQLSSLLNTGLTQQLRNRTWDRERRFVVLAPQMDDRGGMTERSAASVRDFLAFAVANYRVDLRRVYLTGLSGGGAPIYNYLAAERGGIVAAAVIVAGWYSTRARECEWNTVVPVWYFHGAMDDVVNYLDHSTRSYNYHLACEAAPIAPARYTLFSNQSHFIWNSVYDLSARDATSYPIAASGPGSTPFDQSIYDWFLRYAR